MSNKIEQKKSDVDPVMTGGVGVAFVGALIWQTKENKVMNWYFQHYETIYLIAWGVALLVIGLMICIIAKKTKAIKERADLLSPHWESTENNVFVGTTKDKIDLHLSDDLRCTHAQIIGTTGRGKTQSVVIPWTMRDLARGKSVVIIDGKGSLDVPIVLRRNIEKFRLPVTVHEFDLDYTNRSVQINPLKRGTPQQITDRIFSSFEFEDPFYRAIQYDICGYLVRLIKLNELDVTFRTLYELLTDDKKIISLLKVFPDASELKRFFLDYLKSPGQDRKKSHAGLISQLSPFAVGELSQFVNGGKREVILDDVLKDGVTKLFLISVPTLKYQKIGHQLGKLILQDLAFCIGEREKQEQKVFVSVFLDEFSEFVYEEFVSILNKARSAKVALHLSHQSMGDLEKVSQDFAKSVVTNTNIKCVLGLNDPETADYFARHLGTFSEDKLTRQIEEDGLFNARKKTGMGSMREVESYKVHPNQLKQFTNGKGVLHVPTRRGNVTEVIQYGSI